jgi:hypothetical protein
MKCFDVDAIVGFCEAARRFSGEEVDREELRSRIEAEVERVQESQAAFTKASGGAKCRYWITVECEDSDDGDSDGDIMYMRRGPIDTGPKPPGPLKRWGGASCWKEGKCRICLHYECEQVAHQ